MTFQRKPVNTPAPEHQREILDTVHNHLLAATERGAQAIGSSGAAFVIIGMSVWAVELAELDGKATAKYLRSLADLFDPRTNDNQKRRAKKDRAQAVRELYAALDLDMATPEGNA